ncbi:MAG: hypothetical protein ABFR90_05180 [Planctomycetota bacterium]
MSSGENDVYVVVLAACFWLNLLSIGLAFIMTLFAFCLRRSEQAYAFPSCAILWGSGLIAWAVYGNKKKD